MKKTALICFLLLVSLGARATHIVGGEIMYQYLNSSGGNVNYRVTLYLYIDCINGSEEAISQDLDGYINVFRVSDGALLTNLCKTVRRTGPVRVSDVNYKCIKTQPNACVDKYTYQTTVTLPQNGKYILSFERCCRNNSIKNIINPESTGATYWTEVNTGNNNSSPFFKALPPNFLCTNAPLKFDHSATDGDGDSLVYELFHPYDGAGTNTNIASRPDYKNSNNLPHYPGKLIVWESGYSTYFNQIDGNPTLSIDRFSGKLSLTPTVTGQFVIGIKVMEYRKGVKIGETIRDFQFNVSNCVFDVVSAFLVPKLNCSGTEVSFTNYSIGGTRYQWNFGDPATLADTSVFTDPKYTYPNPGTYTIKLVSSNNTCSDTFDYEVNVKPNFKVNMGRDTLYCGSVNKTLDARISGKKYLWNTGETTQSISISKGGSYWVSVTDAPCVARDTIRIDMDLSFLDLGPDSVICRDSFVQFTYGGKPGYRSYLWSDSSRLQSVFIPKLGKYWLKVLNNNNCSSEDSITFVLYPPPRINIRDTLICKGSVAPLDGTNRSGITQGETAYLWNTGDTSSTIKTSIPGMYIIKVRNKLCTVYDTAVIGNIVTGLELGNDTFFCGPVFHRIFPKKGFLRYQWHDGAETIDYTARTPGWKKLTITTVEGCIESDSLYISQFPVIDGGLGNDTTICLSSMTTLTARDSFIAYLWNTGQTGRSIHVSAAGLYKVVFKDRNGCINADSVRIEEKPDAMPVDLFMPNAFTPNEDDLNETYPGNHYKDPGSPYLLRLYNRWGEKIFESESPSVEWDGRIKGRLAPQDVYVYWVKYVGCDNVERWFRGTFTLLR